ncbi:MAG: hypothetical protein AAGF53_01380 [Pseudomonadota bacterium]
MSLAAAQKCEEFKVGFEHVFSQQFVLHPSGGLDLPGFEQLPFSDSFLYFGNTLPVASSKSELQNFDRELIVLGRAVDAEGELVNSRRLNRVLNSVSDLGAITSYIETLAGRYVVLLKYGADKRLYLDPSGTMGVVVNTETNAIGSTNYMVLDRGEEPEPDYPPGHQRYRCAFGYSIDRRIRVLQPNFYYDLRTGEQIRHWPRDGDFSCRTLEELDSLVERVARRHSQIIGALSKAEGPVLLPLSGGQDSRQLFAMTQKFNCKIDLHFTHATNWSSGVDTELAARLCEIEKVDLTTYDARHEQNTLRPRAVRRILSERSLARGEINCSPANFDPKVMKGRIKSEGNIISVTRMPPKGGCLLRGHVSDISKAVLWRGAGVNAQDKVGDPLRWPRIGVKLMMLGEDAHRSEWFSSQYQRWLSGLPDCVRHRSIDFMGLELYRTYTLGAGFYALNNNFYMSPGCDRQIIRDLVSVPVRIRHELQFNDRLLELTAPQLLDVPYMRKADNELRRVRPSLKENLEYYGLSEGAWV